MNKIEINITAKEYELINELNEEDKLLLIAAQEARETAYTPYSEFNVGAAVLLDNGKIIKGSNQENGAYPSGTCAERVAVFYANASYPDVAIKALAISSSIKGVPNKKVVFPCGSCRQVLVESEKRQNKNMKIIMGGESSIIVLDSVSEMLPSACNLTENKQNK